MKKFPRRKIMCACGCGQTLIDKDDRARLRRYIHNHHRRGINFSVQHRERLRQAMKGKTRPPHTDEWKRKMSLLFRHRTGANNPNWKGGVSKEPYPFKFNASLKNKIRWLCGYKCIICKMSERLLGKKLFIHHINYIKTDIGIDNLVALCNSCNSVVNGNREYWAGLLSQHTIFMYKKVG